MKRALGAVAVLAWCAAVAASAQTYEPYKLTQNPYRYYVDGRFATTPGGGLAANVVPDVQDAFTAWNNVPGSYARWTYAGLAVAGNPAGMVRPDNAEDLFSVVMFVTSTTDPYYGLALGGGTKVSGSMPLTYAGQLFACDIFLEALPNGTAWVGKNLPLTANVASVATFVGHEVGHCMSLGHGVPDSNALMWFQTPLGVRRFPNLNDNAYLVPRYPNDGTAVGSPCDMLRPCFGVGRQCASPGGVGNDQNGMAWENMCTQECVPGNPNACPLPYACIAAPGLGYGTGHACLPNTGNAITKIGMGCTTVGQCGGPLAICNVQTTQMSATPLWFEGYCTQNCAAGVQCPNGSECIQNPVGTFRCLKSCRVGFGDCRDNLLTLNPEYACAAIPGATDGVCIPACGGTADCDLTQNPFCRTCDGLCFAQNKPVGTIGDKCSTVADCGAAQVCYKAFPWSTDGVCSQQCETTCSACPNGGNCIGLPYTGGKLYCMRDCLPGTCAVGQQCLTVGGSRACVPACTATSCPAGQSCVAGQCTDSNPPQAPCPLCYVSVGNGSLGGGPGSPQNPDGWYCGCQSAGATGAAVLFAFTFLFSRRARRQWPRR